MEGDADPGNAMNKLRQVTGVALLCAGVYASLMGIILADTRGIIDPVFILAISFGIVSLVMGLTLLIIGSSSE